MLGVANLLAIFKKYVNNLLGINCGKSRQHSIKEKSVFKIISLQHLRVLKNK